MTCNGCNIFLSSRATLGNIDKRNRGSAKSASRPKKAGNLFCRWADQFSDLKLDGPAENQMVADFLQEQVVDAYSNKLDI